MLEYSLSVKLLTEQHLEFLSLKGCCIYLSESTLVNIPHCWKSHVEAHMGIKDDSLCTFGKTNVETTVHLLWNCTITQKHLNIFFMASKFPYSYRTV